MSLNVLTGSKSSPPILPVGGTYSDEKYNEIESWEREGEGTTRKGVRERN